MGSFVGFAKKHNVNPKTKAQERASNQGGKLADDHFQALFLGGVLKRCLPTVDITAATVNGDGTITFGVGEGTIYTVTSDTIDGPPYATFVTGQTVYNERTIAFTVAAALPIYVLDTGRFLIAQGHYS